VFQQIHPSSSLQSDFSVIAAIPFFSEQTLQLSDLEEVDILEVEVLLVVLRVVLMEGPMHSILEGEVEGGQTS
jgi:hypothetical protein